MKKTIWIIFIAFCLPAYSLAGHLEPFRDVPIPEYNPQTPEKVELGKKLFFDRRLSGDGTTNCGTCHDPELAYSDGLEISLHYPTTRNWRNSPTLVNVAFHKYQFHDGRAATLEDQALFPMMSAFELNQNLEYLEEEIRSVPEYVEEFTKVFGDGDTTKERIAMAIAAFERTLISCDAPLDRFLQGEADALSPDALKGYEIFTGKGKCTDCHFGPNLADDKFHALQVPENPEHLTDPRIAATRRFVAKVYHFEEYRTLDEDPGRYLITKDPKDWKAFKTPTLREIAKTAPYMHNGIFATLDEVIDFFNTGCGEGNTVLKPLQLTAEEKEQLKVFLVEGLAGAPRDFTYPKIP
ncbi:MAG: cytochrome c peroxidase [Desulfobulbaceae bacterium]|jgi:cytochrome c peroxidase|nr:cytochrome c peroxidase [Desulfobulbaceae bacterium]MDY0352037.1 cytochrome c peroxidase [Desulfobulbaceae bacterium]